jgi:hypothetical protein
VNFLLSKRQRTFFFARFGENHGNHAQRSRLRTSFRLFRISLYVKSPLLLVNRNTQYIGSIVVQHCFERIIAGRPFKIEVTWVAEKRWRAHILRIPGVPTAMMPFYGETPDEAAAHLSDWLDRAHQHQANTV